MNVQDCKLDNKSISSDTNKPKFSNSMFCGKMLIDMDKSELIDVIEWMNTDSERIVNTKNEEIRRAEETNYLISEKIRKNSKSTTIGYCLLFLIDIIFILVIL